jgi:hypothetical protein
LAETRTRIKRVFLASAAHSQLGWVKEELLKRGIQSCTADELPAMGISVVESTERAIRESDLVIGLIGLQSPQWLFFELGIAKGLGKPILLVVSPASGQEHVPAMLTGTLYVRADPANRQAIGFALDQLLAATGWKPRRQVDRVPSECALGSEVDKYLGFINKDGPELTEQDLHRLVADLLEAGGVSTVIQGSSPGRGADLAVWSDDLQAIVGNPLLVEVKAHIRDRGHLQEVLDQVETYRRNSNTEWALLILPTLAGPRPAHPDVGAVLTLTLTELIEGLRSKSFSEVIRELRNARAHGGAHDG